MIPKVSLSANVGITLFTASWSLPVQYISACPPTPSTCTTCTRAFFENMGPLCLQTLQADSAAQVLHVLCNSAQPMPDRTWWISIQFLLSLFFGGGDNLRCMGYNDPSSSTTAIKTLGTYNVSLPHYMP